MSTGMKLRIEEGHAEVIDGRLRIWTGYHAAELEPEPAEPAEPEPLDATDTTDTETPEELDELEE